MRSMACLCVLLLGCASEPASPPRPSADGGGDTRVDDASDAAVEACPYEAGGACSGAGRIGQCACGGVDWRAVCCKDGRIEITICSDGVHLGSMCGPPVEAGTDADDRD